MSKLIIFVGLPGSGKSYKLKELENEGISPKRIYDDYHANAYNNSIRVTDSKNFTSLIDNLRSGKDCAVADIAFCDESRLRALVDEVIRAVDGIEFDFRYFENNPETCKENVKRRNRESIANEIENIEYLSGKYKIPAGSKIIEVYQGIPRA